MRIYEVSYWNNGSRGDGLNREYFTSKRSAVSRRAEIIRTHQRDKRDFNFAVEQGQAVPADPGEDPEPEISPLHFLGTPLEMVLQALRSRA